MVPAASGLTGFCDAASFLGQVLVGISAVMQTTVRHRSELLRLGLGLALSVLSCTACFGPFVVGDGYLGMTGFVYEIVSATADGDGLVLIDAERPVATADILKPIAGCEITLEPWTPARRPDADTAKLWTSRAKSEANGRFAVGGTASPGWYDATLSLACPGFIPMRRVFRHDRFKHEAMVTMVRAK